MGDRQDVLREMKICRFCLSNDEKDLSSIYDRNNRDAKGSVPLPLQIMACVAIEVFQNDGMPQLICSACRAYTNQAYIFKTNCKKADDALKLFLATGQLSYPHLKPYPQQQSERSVVQVRDVTIEQQSASAITPKKFKIIRKAGASGEVVSKNVKMEEGSEVITLDFTHEEDEDEPAVRQGQNADEIILGMDTDILDESVTESGFGNNEQSSENMTQNVYACDHCDRSFALKQLLDLHVINHLRARTFECKLCEKKFFTKYDLQKHHSTHLDHKPFDCTVCDKSFARETLLRRHEKVHNDVAKYLCTHCDRSYLTQLDLDIHLEKHKKKRAFTCTKCDKSFVFKQGLERHLLTHATEKPYKCNYCEASFSSSIKLTRHITSHAGLRPYPCKLCGRTFLLSHHLTRHMRSHYASQTRNLEDTLGKHKCDSCSMSFRKKDSLINHSAIHSMVNLRCVICNTSFESAKEVKEHITTHLSGLPFACAKCDYSFETAEQLEEHELKHAEMEYEEQIEKEVVAEVKKQMSAGEESMDEDLDTEALPYVPSETASHTEEGVEDEEGEGERQEVGESRRTAAPSEYVSFLKDEIVSDPEDDPPRAARSPSEPPAESIKPIVRSEGTKVYRRKPSDRKAPSVPPTRALTAPLDQITQAAAAGGAPLTLNALAAPVSEAARRLGDLAGARVQRLIISKEEMKQMAKRGLITVKNGMVRARGGSTQPILNAVTLKRVPKADIDGFLSSRPKTPLKQYQRTPSRFVMDTREDSGVFGQQSQSSGP